MNKKILCIVLILGLLMSTFPYITTHNKESTSGSDNISETVVHSSNILSRGDPTTLLLHEDFNAGLGNFTTWNNADGHWRLDSSYDGDSVAMDGDSIFMWGTGGNWAMTRASITTSLDLSGTGNAVSLSLYFAYEDLEISGFTYDYVSIDFDVDGFPDNGWSHLRWKTPTMVHNNNDHSTAPGDYVHLEYDISFLPKNENILLRFFAQFRRSADNWPPYNDNQDLICIDNVTVKANYLPVMVDDSINITSPVIHTLTNESAKIDFSFSDFDGHAADNFSLSADVRLSNNITQLRYVDNITVADTRLSLIKTDDISYNATLYFDPGPSFGFGQIDLSILIFDPDGQACSFSYSDTENAIELRNHLPMINLSSIQTDTPAMNILNPAPMSFAGTWEDGDDQINSDFKITIIVRDHLNNTYALMEDAVDGDDGLTVVKSSPGTYDFEYIWEPDNTFISSYYDILLDVKDGYGGQASTIYEDHEDIFELFEVYVEGVDVSPSFYNRYDVIPIYMNFTVAKNTTGVLNFHAADINISLRSSNGTIFTIHPNEVRNGNIEIINLTDDTVMISFMYENPMVLPNDEFDIRMALRMDGREIFVTGYGANPSALATYFNIAPEILSLSVLPARMNTYHKPSGTITASFRDSDIHSTGTFSFNLSMRNPSGDIIQLYSSGSEGGHTVDVSSTDNDGFVANFTFRIKDIYETGKYDVQLSMVDEYGGTSLFPFSENEDMFELYFNEPPSPPDNLLPDETRDTSPFIHWYGASDGGTDANDLQYYIRIGTGLGTDDILPWQSVGKNPFYQVVDTLPFDTYFIEVMATDGIDNSTPLRDEIEVFVLANLPPTPPNAISPDFTLEILPRITWSGTEDGDGDIIKNNYLQIGTSQYANDTLPWVDVGRNEYYQVQKELSFGSYYVQVKVSDGYSMSYIRQELLHVVGEGNAPPSPPTEMYPTSTWDTMPNVTWVGAYDINNDTLKYSIQIGSTSGEGDVLPWVEGLPVPYYIIRNELPKGKYYVQIKAFDGEYYSLVFESILEITEIGNIPPLPVTNITPMITTNATPLITWKPAVDPDGPDKDIVYFIQIGSSKGHGDALSWFPTKNYTRYAVSKGLEPNRVYYIQIKAFDGEGYSPVAYQTLEIIVYITEVYFDVSRMNQTVEKGERYTFHLRVVNRGTIEDTVTVTISTDDRLLPYIIIPTDNITLDPETEYLIPMELFIPEKAGILGNFTINATCRSKVSSFFSVAFPSFTVQVTDKAKTTEPLVDRLLEEHRLEFTILVVVIVLVLILIVVLLIVKRIKNRIPAELVERDDEGDSAETTYVPQVVGGVVAKRIMPEPEDLFGDRKDTPRLPAPGGSTDKQLPAQKKRLALPQYSVVIDMNTKQVVGHTETADAGKEDDEDEGDILDFQFVDGKYEIQTTSVPSSHPYQKPSPTPSVPGEHLYKAPPPVPSSPNKYQAARTERSPAPPSGRPVAPPPAPSQSPPPAPSQSPSTPNPPPAPDDAAGGPLPPPQ